MLVHHEGISYVDAKRQLRTLELKAIAENTSISRKGGLGYVAHMVQSGSVEICKTEDGDKKVLGVNGRGGVFGEMALIDSELRMASAIALTPTIS